MRFRFLFPERRACRVRCVMLDYPLRFRGHDERAPPCRRDLLVRSAAQPWMIHRDSAGTTSVRLRPSEGPACQVRRVRLDRPFHFGGRDRHAPPPRRDLLVVSTKYLPLV